jgi:hypothetical protein
MLSFSAQFPFRRRHDAFVLLDFVIQPIQHVLHVQHPRRDLGALFVGGAFSLWRALAPK